MKIGLKAAADELRGNNDFHILTHKNPDGDTLGCAFGLWHMLTSMGKRATVFCADDFPERYSFLYEGYEPTAEGRGYTVAVDIADVKLLGGLAAEYADSVDLCIDHHITNEFYAKKTCVDPAAAAACELIWLLCGELALSPDASVATCLYTGIATDSGCFKYGSTTPRTHTIAAELLAYDFDFAEINRRMFDIKSRGRIRLEAYLFEHTEYFADGRAAMIFLPQKLVSELGLEDSDLDGISSLPLQAEGVWVAVMVREKSNDSCKVSMRSSDKINVSEICSRFGGGGHISAAGCELTGTPAAVAELLRPAVEAAFRA